MDGSSTPVMRVPHEAEAYEKVNFEVRMVEQDGKYLVYTRRVVKEGALTEP